MDARTLMEMNDYVKDRVETNTKKLNEWIESARIAINQVMAIIKDNFHIYMVVFLAILVGLKWITIGEACTIGCMIEAFHLLDTDIKAKHRLKLLSELDIERLGNSKSASDLSKLSINEIIGEYVEDCFNRDVLFLNPPKPDDYITEAQEKEYLNTLIDSATKNMSEMMYEKLSMYVGEEGLSVLIGRKCLATITIFVASHNHKMYSPIDESKTIRTSNMPE